MPPTPPGETSCTLDAKRDIAPQLNSTTKYQAGEGGTADITRTGPSELTVAGTTPTPGWSDIVFTASGQSVHVKFIDGANPRHFVRLVVTLNNAGTEIHVRVITCNR